MTLVANHLVALQPAGARPDGVVEIQRLRVIGLFLLNARKNAPTPAVASSSVTERFAKRSVLRDGLLRALLRRGTAGEQKNEKTGVFHVVSLFFFPEDGFTNASELFGRVG